MSGTDKTLRAGAGKADISPETGIQIAGDIGRRRPCTGIKEPIDARALVLQRGDDRYCILSINVLAIDNPWADEIRRRLHEAHGFDPAAVLIHITQNHAAPSIGNHFCRDSCDLFPPEYPWLRGGDVQYNEPALAGVMEAVDRAVADVTPVTVAAGRTTEGRVAFNRRFVLRDGTAVCHPPVCSPDILHVEGPTDPEVGVVTFTAADDRIKAALLHHTCHPVHGFGANDVIAGWAGAWCREMEPILGDNCVPLVINGCCGNVHHCDHLNPGRQNDHLDAGRFLAEAAQRALEHMTPVTTDPFTWKQRVLLVPRRPVPPELLEEAREMLRRHPQPLWKDEEHVRVEWDWVYAVGIMDIADEQKSDPDYPYEIQALRIGDFALLALMGEPFVEAQLRIKRESPFAFTHVAHMCNGYLGYVPTPRAFRGGGYETRTGRGSRLVPEALDRIREAAVEMLGEIGNAG